MTYTTIILCLAWLITIWQVTAVSTPLKGALAVGTLAAVSSVYLWTTPWGPIPFAVLAICAGYAGQCLPGDMLWARWGPRGFYVPGWNKTKTALFVVAVTSSALFASLLAAP